MKKMVARIVILVVCVLGLVCFSSTSFAGGGPTSMLESMKDQISELRMYLMPTVYVVSDGEIESMKHGKWAGWNERCIEWYSVPVVNREYDATVRVPAGSYKLFFMALGGENYTPALFYSAQEDIYEIKNGETVSPLIIMNPLGYPIKINIGNTDIDFSNIDGKMQCLLDGNIWIEDINISKFWGDEFYSTSFFHPYGATDIKLVVNTNSQLLEALINWDGVIDSEITINLQSQATGGIISPTIVFPEEMPDSTN